MRSGRVLRYAGALGTSALLLGQAHAWATGVAAASSTALYVAAGGSSGNTDTSCATAAYTTITSAVDAAQAGATVVVCAGTYAEDVVLPKALTLAGQGATIDATGLDNGVTITASAVTVEGFTVENATGEGILAHAIPIPGPVVNGQQLFTGHSLTRVVIKHNVVEHNDLGTPTSSYKECQPQGQVPGDCGEGIHLMGVADSDVLINTVTDNSGGILLTDEFGPTHGNLIAGNIVSDNAADCGITLASHNLGRNPTTAALMPAFGGVYGNVVRDDIVVDNGLQGAGSGIGIFAPFPGAAAYDNLVEGNTTVGNGQSGISLHSHAPGAWIGGNRIVDNLVGPNNLVGDSDATPPDTATTGILVWSAASPVGITIAGNTVFDDWYGIWLSATVRAPGAAHSNTFLADSTHVHVA